MAKPGTLKIDHHVLSADGTRYVVRYVATRTYDGVTEEQADLVPVDEDATFVGGFSNRITLPTAELRRVAAMQLPPIEGMPAERPRCPMCDKRLQPRTDYTYDGMQRRKVIKRTFDRWRGYPITRESSEKFCTQVCAYKFARAAYAAGYRIVRKKAGGAS